MTKNVFLLIIGLAFLISCNKNESPEFYIINGEIKNFEGKIYLIPAVDTLYYSNNFREDTATVVDGKFKFRLSTKFETPLPFRIRTDNSITNQFIMESKDQLIEIEEMSPMIKPSISCENSTVHSEDVSLAERRQASREELGIAMNSLNNSKFSNDSIQKPDVYFLLLDAYSGDITLKNDFEFEGGGGAGGGLRRGRRTCDTVPAG